MNWKRWPNLQWSKEIVETGAGDFYNGRVNMAAVKKHNPTFANYPAFSRVHVLNPGETNYTAESKGIWYLPARNELSSIYKEGNQEKIARTLEALGLETPFPSQISAWSSTEYYALEHNTFFVSIIYLATGAFMREIKTNKFEHIFAWPIMAFEPPK